MKRNNRFKYIYRNFYNDIEELDEWYKRVECPLPFKNLPEGEYLIRGDKKSCRKKYFHLDNLWFLVEDVTKDNGYYQCDAAIYQLFPANLSEKEWSLMNQIDYKRLSKIWQRYRYGYNFYMELRKLRRGVILWDIKYNKQQNNDI